MATEMKSVLYFNSDYGGLVGRALTADEYENITAQELIDAIRNCACGGD